MTEILRFEPMNHGAWVGVIEHLPDNKFRWAVEPEYTWPVAKQMADRLNAEPGLDPDVLTEIVEAAA